MKWKARLDVVADQGNVFAVCVEDAVEADEKSIEDD